jgi:hypothetical protein
MMKLTQCIFLDILTDDEDLNDDLTMEEQIVSEYLKYIHTVTS